MKYKFFKVGGRVCCQGDDWSALCPNCKVKASQQEQAIRAANAKHNDLLRRQREEQARIDASRGNPGKGNEMRIGQGQGHGQGQPTPTPAGCRCGKCGGIKPATATATATSTPAPEPAQAPAASPLRAATIARIAPHYPGANLNALDDELLAFLDAAVTNRPAIVTAQPAITAASNAGLRKLPDPFGVNDLLEKAQEQQNAINRWSAAAKAAREFNRNNPNLRPLPDPWNLKRFGIE